MLQDTDELFRTEKAKPNEKLALARYLEKIGEIEEKVEATRFVLMENQNFDISGLFSLVADLATDKITKISLRRFLESNYISLQSESINLLFSSMDRDRDGVINFRDFYDSISGRQSYHD
jgi:Ca2+-binding EF-hand superfamily protein